MFKKLKISLYLLQLENYDIKRFQKALAKTKDIEVFKQKIVWTKKLLLVNFLLFLFLPLAFILGLY